MTFKEIPDKPIKKQTLMSNTPHDPSEVENSIESTFDRMSAKENIPF